MAEKTVSRNDIESKYKWNLNKICNGDEQFNSIIEDVSNRMDKITSFEGKLDNSKELLSCLKFNSKIYEDIVRVYAYAMMSHDQNTKDPVQLENVEKASNIYSKYSVLSAFINPEMSELDESYLRGLATDKKFEDYDIFLLEVLRTKGHTLSKKEEAILARAGEVFGMFSDIFSMTNNADIKFGEVMGEDGEKVELTHSKYGLLMSSEDREIRKGAYEKCYETYKNLIHTISSTYIGNVKKDVFLAKTRKFDSALEYAMFYENVDKVVYEKLLRNAEKGLEAVHEYVSFRKEVMNLDQINFYDLYVALIENNSLKCSYEDAYDIVKKALAPLGEDYHELLERAYSEGWIDVFPSEGKRSGAYSNSIYGVDPYVLLNYEKTPHEIFTIAHELGHAMHSYYSNANQCAEKADYTIFVAEVASTVNEVLLIYYLTKNSKDEDTKKFCLNYFLDMFRTTMFRQTMFAEFEYVAHDLCEKDIPLTHQTLCAEYEKLNKKYYGEEITHDDFIKYEWARIPHFYRSFYVYKYATGIISAITIAFGIIENGEQSVAKYKKFLSSGGSDKPTELLKIAGVDLESDVPYEKAVRIFEETLDMLKKLYK